jgi:hypothetical protein
MQSMRQLFVAVQRTSDLQPFFSPGAASTPHVMLQSVPEHATGPPAQSSFAQAMLHVPASHWTPPAHEEEGPEQSTLHAEPTHFTPPAHVVSPVQAMSQRVA